MPEIGMQDFADANRLSRQRIMQLINEDRIRPRPVLRKLGRMRVYAIDPAAKILPPTKKIGRPRKHLTTDKVRD